MRKSKKRNMTMVISVFIIGVFALWITTMGIGNKAKNDQKKHLLDAINRSITNCYSIEGRYPSSIEYLQDNYGLSINKDRYIISYDNIASNIRPRIRIYER